MAQILLLGLGGTGSRVVNNVAKLLQQNGQSINNGQMCCAVLDTNVNDTAAIQKSLTGIPVFETSRDNWDIQDYFDHYSHKDMEAWCPKSPTFLSQSMVNGASELRMKSRVALMDCLDSGVARELECKINTVLKNNSDSKIRVMIVSSLSGGTGSGMFIQVALWLRKILSESEITIRGIFLMPDVFVNTLDDIRENRATRARHYCNAYAAIRELNAITKIREGSFDELSERIVIDGLFDSDDYCKENAEGEHLDSKPVYDLAFFVDDKDENGLPLDSMSEYEKMVAQLVYMQLYAPMKNNMYSEEDNAFLSMEKCEDPMYGSCGTAMAVYPRESVKEYCAKRAARELLTDGWQNLDGEIKALQQEKKDKEADGIFSDEVIDVRKKYMELFDRKTTVKADQVGSDRFFQRMAMEVKNVTLVEEGDKIVPRTSDKVADFLKLLKEQRINKIVERHSGVLDLKIEDEEEFVKATHSEKELLERVETDRDQIETAIAKFEKRAEAFAEQIVDEVFPYSMGDVRPSNECSIYGLLNKTDEEGTRRFIHPVAARYVLYKLDSELKRMKKGIALKTSRQKALSGGDVGMLFDNKRTKTVEVSPEQLLDSRQWYQSERKFTDDFEKRYCGYINTRVELCSKYEKEMLQDLVYKALIERVGLLIKQLELFFSKLGEVREKLDKEIKDNLKETNGTVGKVMYVYGSPEAKEYMYQSLDFSGEGSDAEVNRNVIEAIYGNICAQKRPSHTANEKYKKVGVVKSFIAGLVNSCAKKIENDQNNREKIAMDIYTAVCRESDAKWAKDEADKRNRARKDGVEYESADEMDSINFETGEVQRNDAEAQRHEQAFVKLRDDLFYMAAPFLRHSTEVADNALGMRNTRPKTFWGFHPDLIKAYPAVGQKLGGNEDIQSDEAYPRNELFCYRAVYGLTASYIPKFREKSGEKDESNYYKNYRIIVDEMVQDAAGKVGSRAYVRTPHLDKNWHRILPYITAEKRQQAELEFYRGFWLAIAYGVIKTDKEGKLYVKHSLKAGTKEIPVMYDDRAVFRTNVEDLLAALKMDSVFVDSVIPALEEQFKDELKAMSTYVGTKVLQGLMTKKEDLNPINVVTRYNEILTHNEYVSTKLVEALEAIAGNLALGYGIVRADKQFEAAKFRICRKIYDSSTRVKGKADSFMGWEEKFAEYKISEENLA